MMQPQQSYLNKFNRLFIWIEFAGFKNMAKHTRDCNAVV
jgi:hypothetical protein